MEAMSQAEIREFLLGAARTAKIATVSRDGSPHVTPIWFDMDGEALMFTTWHNSVKGKQLKQDNRLAICVDDETPPFAYVIIEGKAEFIDDPQQLLEWATRISGRYMGANQAESYGRRNAVPGEMLVRVVPEKLIARKNISE